MVDYFKIVSKNDLLIGSNKEIDIVFYLENEILSAYFYVLYKDRKNELKDERYKFSDWKWEKFCNNWWSLQNDQLSLYLSNLI